MIVGVCGLGWTGSGAVKDLLTEYAEIYNVGKHEGDYEFAFTYRPDGILDLQYHLFDGACRDVSSKIAINRFIKRIESDCKKPSRIQRITKDKYLPLSRQYIESITQIKFKYYVLQDYYDGGWLKNLEARVRYKIQRILDKRCDHFVSAFPLKDCFFSIKPEKFVAETKKYIASIIDAMCDKKDRIILLDQPFAGDRPERSMQFFEDPYAVVVDRDPRDLFLMMKRVCFFEGEMMNDVDKFITYYHKIRENISPEKNDRILRIQFEDLIYKYDEMVKIIEDFLHVTNHAEKRKYFNPDVSINNTQLWRRFPEETENIKRIEQELADWLYPFEQYGEQKISGECF